MKSSFIATTILLFLVGCVQHKPSDGMFISLNPDNTGIHFNNRISENDSINVLDNEYVYNGGGTAIADLNNDGKPDIVFTGNMVENRLYLNRGNFKFKDISQESGFTKKGQWSTGVMICDVNNDGKKDILICNSIYGNETRRRALLYINQGWRNDGVPHFLEKAHEYGLDDAGHNAQAVFLDYDHDGDLDVLFITNQITEYPNLFKKKEAISCTADHLYRNDWDSTLGHPFFRDVSLKAGMKDAGFSLGVSVADFNNDGWEDIYISNDYLSNDLLYINNRDGTFTNRIQDYFQHQSLSAMGNDVADINNDGWPDVITTEMLPEDNKRKKLMLGGNNYQEYVLNAQFNIQHQYIRNTLQLSRGNKPLGSKDSIADSHPVFSEISLLAGVAETDWSWSPLLADFDNDGYRDLLITNGFPKDISDHDFSSFRSSATQMFTDKRATQKLIPVVKIPNYLYKNNHHLGFINVSKEWGMDIPSFSNGAAYADLNGDGKLDLVINNIDSTAFIMKNTGKTVSDNSSLQVRLIGPSGNRQGLGAKVYLYSGGMLQYQEYQVSHGYLSCMDDGIHFGMGHSKKADSLRVIWPDKKSQILFNIAGSGNQLLKYNDASAKVNDFPQNKKITPLLSETSCKRGINFNHKETDFIDFNVQKTLPHKLSQYGPGIAIGDLNGDGLDDILIGGPTGIQPSIYYQERGSKFRKAAGQGEAFLGETDARSGTDLGKKEQEDMGLLIFDADGDGDMDIYISSGSQEAPPGSAAYQDRLYVNTGKGHFKLEPGALPVLHSSKSCVRAADYDRDGKLDLFVGGRLIPEKYPSPAQSMILHNVSKVRDHPVFKNVNGLLCPELDKVGLVSDAIWTDFNNDGLQDLILAGEWMPITFLVQKDGRFVNATAQSGLSGFTGWWNSIVSGDFDNDGDMDYIVGNLGLNSLIRASRLEPARIFAKDFDDNGSYDAVMETYVMDSSGSRRAYPYPKRDDIIKQLLVMRRRFPKYADYGRATIDKMFSSQEMQGALILKASCFSSVYLENLGNGKFKLHPLPVEAQFSPVFGLQVADLDHDGNLDILATGNDYGCELMNGRFDASCGLLLLGDGNGNFQAMSPSASGFYVNGDAKALAVLLMESGQALYLACQNRGPLLAFEPKRSSPSIKPGKKPVPLSSLDCSGLVTLKDGKKRRVEFNYGDGFLSQSSRTFWSDPTMKSIEISTYNGSKRKIGL